MARDETCSHHYRGYSFWLAARDFLYAPTQTGQYIPWSLLYQSWSTSWNQKWLNGSIIKDWSDDPLHHEQTCYLAHILVSDAWLWGNSKFKAFFISKVINSFDVRLLTFLFWAVLNAVAYILDPNTSDCLSTSMLCLMTGTDCWQTVHQMNIAQLGNPLPIGGYAYIGVTGILKVVKY